MTSVATSQPTLWDYRPRAERARAPRPTATPPAPAPAKAKARAKKAAPPASTSAIVEGVDLVIDAKAPRYRQAGTQWCGEIEWILLVDKADAEHMKTAVKYAVLANRVHVAP